MEMKITPEWLKNKIETEPDMYDGGSESALDDLLVAALKLYEAPFKYNCGYIFDAKGAMVADEAGTNIVRVRGWGRISYMDNPAMLQDRVGEVIADALTEYWEKHLGN